MLALCLVQTTRLMFRRVKLVAPCCGEVVWCRHCHNAVKHDAEQVSDDGLQCLREGEG
jgi:hypothetical protein